MATTQTSDSDILPAFHELGADESHALFDAMARDLLGMTGDEFLARRKAGDFADADAPGNSDVMFLALLVARDE